MWGGVGIAHTFIQLRLIDEYRLNIHPVMLGSGLSLFKDSNDKIKLKFLEAKTFSSGVVLLSYQTQNDI